MERRLTVAALGALALAGCASTPAARPAAQQAVGAPRFNAAGLDGVMGRNARALESLFGRPELDIREGEARKLQFTGPACVLDTYLYPRAAGADPIVTYVDARLPDGGDIDRASCVAALQAQRR